MLAQPADLDAFLDGGAGRRLEFVDTASPSTERSVRIPLAVIQGERPGPTAWINACLHGDEYLGPAAILALLERLRPESVRGRVLLSPTLNPGAVQAMERMDPAQPEDMNRRWSGASRSQALSPAVPWAEAVLLARTDAVIDLHSGGNRFLQAPFTVYPRVGAETDREACALAKACGLPFVWAHEGSILEGALITAAGRMGKPAVLIEMEGEGKAEPAWIDGMVAAVEGALGHLGVLGTKPRFRDSYEVFEGFTIVRNREEGLWTRGVEPAAAVARGGVLGTVRDLLGRELETVASPVDGTVVGICTYGFVPRDDYVAELAHGFHTEGPPG